MSEQRAHTTLPAAGSHSGYGAGQDNPHPETPKVEKPADNMERRSPSIDELVSQYVD